MKVKWPVVREVSMVVRFCKVILCFQGWFQSFSDFMDSSKGADERDSQEESEANPVFISR
jgi:1,4-dihydroxy-2-naphthoate octaprenyltransferase